jgi:dolichol-phosphate mannosyltransferase
MVVTPKNSCLIIIPAYNEEALIQETVDRAKQYADVCVIDDCSKDATPDILSRIDNIKVITHTKNTHIPGGLLDGMRYAVENNYEYAIAMDAGLSHNPDELPLFIQHPHCDLLIGVRTTKIDTPLYRRALSRVGNAVYNVSLDFPFSAIKSTYYKDIPSGFRRYSKDAMTLLLSKQWSSKSFDVLLETVMFIYRGNLTISEVPISYRFTNSSLNKNVVKDCLRMASQLILHPKASGR